MGYIKESADVVRESLKGISNKKKFKKLIDNMIFAIETDTVSGYFLYKFKLLEELAPLIKLKMKRDKEYLDKYKQVKKYYNHHYKKRVVSL
ncbi:MAG: hypothetical protein ACW986_10500 [Promethearchaeota archaeon]|jgi:hypothetical protein